MPGPWAGEAGPREPSARLEGGTGGLAAWVELGVVLEVAEVEGTPNGDEVPAAEVPGAASPAEGSPWDAGAPPPRSIKRERSFLSRVWISSSLPWDSIAASHLLRYDQAHEADGT